MPQTPTREEALALLKQYNQSESLIKHALAVEGVMRYFAKKLALFMDQWSSGTTIVHLDRFHTQPAWAGGLPGRNHYG